MPGGDDTFDVLCYGTISVDHVTRLPYLPTPSRDAPASVEYDGLGGEAVAVAIPLAAWGLRVLVAGNVIGTDSRADFILHRLARYPSVDTQYIQRQPGVSTPFSRTLVTPDGERRRILYGFEAAPQAELDEAVMLRAELLSVDAYGREERDRAACVAHGLGKPVITSDAIWPETPLASLSDVVIMSNAWLHSHFTTAYEYDHALELQGHGAGVVIVTDGPHPVLVVRADGSPFGVEPYDIPELLDTSGAGTLFKAGLVYAWLRREWSLEQKVKFACAAAGLSCQRKPGHNDPPTLPEIASLMREQPR